MKSNPLRSSVIGSYPFPSWLEFASQHLDVFGRSDVSEIQNDAVIAAVHGVCFGGGLAIGGLMVFDDYMWGNPRDALHRPKIAIDVFTNIFGETAEIVHVGYQLVVCKKG